MKIVPKAQLIKAYDQIAKRRKWLEALISPTAKITDEEKLYAILKIAKSLNDPTVAEGALYASNVLNGKGLALRQGAKYIFEDDNFGILPSAVLVGP